MQGACVCMKSICYTDAKSSVVRAQDFTCVAEAALAEKALSLSKELEAGVAGIMNLFDKHWPAGLGTLEEVKSMLAPSRARRSCRGFDDSSRSTSCGRRLCRA